MKSITSRTPSIGLLALTILGQLCSPSHAAPYIGWNSDYTGNEAGAILLWKFDDPNPLVDSATNPDYGDYPVSLASVGASTGNPGRFGQSFQSAGPRSTSNDSYATAFGSGAAFHASSISVNFWWQPLSTTPGSDGAITLFDKKFSTNSGVSLTMLNTGNMQFAVGNGTTSSTLTVTAGSIGSWSTSTWYNLAVSYENVAGDGVLKMYRDGNLLGQQTATGFGDLAAGTNLWRVGNRLGSLYGSAPGFYDNFFVSEVAYDFAPIPEPGTVTLAALGLVAAVAFRRFRAKQVG